MKSVSIIGLGYVGLPSAAVIADVGYKTLGVDINPEIVKTINQGNIHILEPGLEQIVKRAVKTNSLEAFVNVQVADVHLLCVPTPFNRINKKPNIDCVINAINSLSNVLMPGNLIIIESTCPVGTTEKILKLLNKLRQDLVPNPKNISDASINIAYCPERILPGNVIYELVHNSRVIGGMSEECSEKAKLFYSSFVKGNLVLASNSRTAELAKLSENAFRDLNIAFANELSNIAKKLNINATELTNICNLHPRVNILQHGVGVGGHCIAVDPWFIVNAAPEEAKLIQLARQVNDNQPEVVCKKIVGEIHKLRRNDIKKNLSVKFYGMTYKPDIDDLRESPALNVITRLINELNDIDIYITDPHVEFLPPELKGCKKIELDEKNDASLHVMLVKHTLFQFVKAPEKYIDMTGLWN